MGGHSKSVKKDGPTKINLKSISTYQDATIRMKVVEHLLKESKLESDRILYEYHDMITWNNVTGGSTPECYPSFTEFLKKHYIIPDHINESGNSGAGSSTGMAQESPSH